MGNPSPMQLYNSFYTSKPTNPPPMGCWEGGSVLATLAAVSSSRAYGNGYTCAHT
jgi:hypothetical protein